MMFQVTVPDSRPYDTSCGGSFLSSHTPFQPYRTPAGLFLLCISTDTDSHCVCLCACGYAEIKLNADQSGCRSFYFPDLKTIFPRHFSVIFFSLLSNDETNKYNYVIFPTFTVLFFGCLQITFFGACPEILYLYLYLYTSILHYII